MRRRQRVHGVQRGAMIYMTLIILLLVTVLATTAISLTTGEQKMATGNQAMRAAFHASESAINAAINDDDALLDAVVLGTRVLAVDLGNTQITSTATINLTGSGTATGFSLGVEGGTFGAYQFEIVGSGEIADVGSKAESVQGLYKIAPSG